MKISSKFLSYMMMFIVGIVLSACNGANSNSGSDNNENGGFQASDVVIMKAMAADVSDHRVDCQGHGKSKKKDKVCVAVCHRPPGNPANSKSMILPLSAVVAHLNHGSAGHEVHDTLGYCEEGNGGDDDGDNDDSGDDDSVFNHGKKPDKKPGKKPGKNCGKNHDDDVGDDNSGDYGDDDSSGDNDGGDYANDDSGSYDDDLSGDDYVEAPTCTDLPCDDSGTPIEDMGDVEDAPVIPPFCEANYDIDKNCDGFHDELGIELY